MRCSWDAQVTFEEGNGLAAAEILARRRRRELEGGGGPATHRAIRAGGQASLFAGGGLRGLTPLAGKRNIRGHARAGDASLCLLIAMNTVPMSSVNRPFAWLPWRVVILAVVVACGSGIEGPVVHG